jgi:hypothetical protein
VRDDLLLFGEHLGAPPDPNDYVAAGMRIANDNFLNTVGGSTASARTCRATINRARSPSA